MSEPLNPVQVESLVRDLANRIHASIPVVSGAEAAMVDARRALDRAEARAYLRSEGTVRERDAMVHVDVVPERDAYDVAYLAFRDAERRMKALTAQLSAAQSIGRSVTQMYGSTR